MSRGRHSSGSRVGMLGLMALILPMGLLILPTSLLVLAGMIPSMVAYAVDRHDDKTAALTVGSMNICGVMPFCIQLWQHGHVLRYAIDLLSQPVTFMVMYSAAAVGWLLYFTIPPLVAGWSASRDQARIVSLDDQRQALTEIWGQEVTSPTQANQGGENSPAAQEEAEGAPPPEAAARTLTEPAADGG